MRTLAVTVLAPLLALGCASGSKQAAAPKDAESSDTPLPLDPTEPVELAQWWTNGRQLVRLGPDGFYRLYDDNNRYHEPQERGKWWQQSYATIWLEPYDELRMDPTRARLHRDGDRLVMDVRSYPSMEPLDAPPVVLEDHLFGRWIGGGGTLQLGDDLRYSYSPRQAPSIAPAELASQEGEWVVKNDLLVLRPDSAGMMPILVRIRGEDEAITLELAEGRLVRSPVVLQDS